MLKIISAVYQPVNVTQKAGKSASGGFGIFFILSGILQKQIQIGTLFFSVFRQLHDREKVGHIIYFANQTLQCDHAGDLPQLLQCFQQIRTLFLENSIFQCYCIRISCQAQGDIKRFLRLKQTDARELLCGKPEHGRQHYCGKRGVQKRIVQDTEHIQQDADFPCLEISLFFRTLYGDAVSLQQMRKLLTLDIVPD